MSKGRSCSFVETILTDVVAKLAGPRPRHTPKYYRWPTRTLWPPNNPAC
jgi:hypothetical protein